MIKKLFFLTVLSLLAYSTVTAGGIVTNTNQSARYVRLISMNSTLSIDGVYYNPAGLTRLNEGWHLSVGNQFVQQNKYVYNNYPLLNDREDDGYKKYQGVVNAPLYPNFYAAWKKGPIAISFGFNIVGGGGSAIFDSGLPSFEMPVSNLPSMVSSFPNPLDPTSSALPTTGYQVDINFEGTSIYYGTQLGITYEIANSSGRYISLFAGARYVIAQNSYSGSIKDIMINPNNPALGMMLANAGLTTYPLDGRYTNATDLFSTLGGFLGNLPGMEPYVAMMNAAADQTTDKYVDVKQTGSGITPIVGVNVSLMEDKLVLASTFEFKTKMKLTNETTRDDTGMFPDGEETGADMPAFLRIGASYSITDKWRVNLGYNEYFDKGVDWDGKEESIENNLYELLFGLEYKINDKWLASCGYSYANTGVMEDYHTDISYSIDSHTVGAGAEWKFAERFTLNGGVLYGIYSPEEQTVPVSSENPIEYTNRYDKNTLVFALGLDFDI